MTAIVIIILLFAVILVYAKHNTKKINTYDLSQEDRYAEIIEPHYEEIVDLISGFSKKYGMSATESDYNMLFALFSSKFNIHVNHDTFFGYLKGALEKIGQDRIFLNAYNNKELDDIDDAISFTAKNVENGPLFQCAALIKYSQKFGLPIPDDLFTRFQNFEKAQFESSLLEHSSPAIDSIESMTGREFEEYLAELFKKLGYGVELTTYVGDQGADLLLTKNGHKTCVQAKRYSSNVNNKAIQEVVASIAHYGANKAMVVTTGRFTNGAVQLAKSNGVVLVDKDELAKLISEAS
jgi:restriction system protein